jgi:hypothetical protein
MFYGVIKLIEFIAGNEKITFTGIDGNYGSRTQDYNVHPQILDNLKKIHPSTVDILLLHESPFNVPVNSKSYELARKLIIEIDRLQPQLVISGHTGMFSEIITEKEIRFINLDDMCNGYGIIVLHEKNLNFERRRVFYGK